MLVLAIDTATPDLVTGLVDTDTQQTWENTLHSTRHHNEVLVPCVQELLATAQSSFEHLGAIVVGCGPGPFTGLRVGMATAQAFGDALDIPVHGICTHDAIATAARRAHPRAKNILICTDARRRETYWAGYQDGTRTQGPGVIKPESLDCSSYDLISIPAVMREKFELPSSAQIIEQAPTPWAMIENVCLGSTPAPLVPLYLRRPDAVEPSKKPLSSAIPADYRKNSQ